MGDLEVKMVEIFFVVAAMIRQIQQQNIKYI